MRWLPEIRERCCGYVALVEELVKAIGAKGSILAQQLWELAPSIRDYITKAIDALPAVPTAEEIASMLEARGQASGSRHNTQSQPGVNNSGGFGF